MDENKDLEQLENKEPEQAAEESAAPEKASDKKKTAITVAVCAIVLAVAVAVAVYIVCGKGSKPAENESETSATTQIEIVTDESGEAVTDAQGETVTQIVTQPSGSGNSQTTNKSAEPVSQNDNQGGSIERETTTSAKAEKRTLKLYVKTPLENSEADVLIVFVNGVEDSRYDVAIDGNEYYIETAEKYKGDVEVMVQLENYQVVTVNQIGGVYDTADFVMPLNHVEQGEID